MGRSTRDGPSVPEGLATCHLPGGVLLSPRPRRGGPHATQRRACDEPNESSSVPRRGHGERRGHRARRPPVSTPRRVAGPCASSPRPTSRSSTRCGRPPTSPATTPTWSTTRCSAPTRSSRSSRRWSDKHSVSQGRHEVHVHPARRAQVARRPARGRRGLRRVAQALDEEGPLRPAAGRPHRQGRARRPQDVHAWSWASDSGPCWRRSASRRATCRS